MAESDGTPLISKPQNHIKEQVTQQVAFYYCAYLATVRQEEKSSKSFDLSSLHLLGAKSSQEPAPALASQGATRKGIDDA